MAVDVRRVSGPGLSRIGPKEGGSEPGPLATPGEPSSLAPQTSWWEAPVPGDERRTMLRFKSGTLQYVGRCPKCRAGGVLYWRKRSRNFRCSYCKEVVPDEDLAFRPEEGRAAVEAAWEALRRASARLAAGDQAGVRVSVADVEGCLQRVEAVVARRGLGPMAACRAASGREPGPPAEASGKEGSRRAREYMDSEEGQAWLKRMKGLLEGAGSSARGRRRRGTSSGRTRSGPTSGPR